MIYLLTPTGDRPECLALLAGHITAQTYRGLVRWVVVDDGEKKSPVPRMPGKVFCMNFLFEKGDGNTQALNMARGLDIIPDDATVLIFEDDDCYLPGHIENLLAALELSELVGERAACYYNVATGRSRTMRGGHHAAMASAGARGEALKTLRAVCEGYNSALDLQLWKDFQGSKKLLDTRNVIGIKGMPGRRGIGVGHRANFGSADTSGVLESWLGPELASVYKSFGAQA